MRVWENFQASLRDAVDFDSPPGAGSAGLLSDAPTGHLLSQASDHFGRPSRSSELRPLAFSVRASRPTRHCRAGLSYAAALRLDFLPRVTGTREMVFYYRVVLIFSGCVLFWEWRSIFLGILLCLTFLGISIEG